MRYLLFDENKVEDSIDQFQKSSLLQQQRYINYYKNQKKRIYFAKFQTQFYKSKNNIIRSCKTDKNENYEQLEYNVNQYSQSINNQSFYRDQQRKLYVRNNVLVSKEYHTPQFDMDDQFNLYNRPKFKDYTSQDASYKYVVELKNKQQLNEMTKDEFVKSQQGLDMDQKFIQKILSTLLQNPKIFIKYEKMSISIRLKYQNKQYNSNYNNKKAR